MDNPINVYKIELMIIDFDEVGEDEIKAIIEDSKYPNHCISPEVKSIAYRTIDWKDDNHPLNKTATADQFYQQLFANETRDK